MNDDEYQEYLNEQFFEYEQKTSMTKAEHNALRRWVHSGHNVYEAPGSRYYPDGGMPEGSFLSVYREDARISRILKGKTEKEKAAWLWGNLT